MNDTAVILFTKIPIPGKTKTRLQPLLSADECCLLQSAFIRDVYRALQQTQTCCDVVVYHTIEGVLEDLQALIPEASAFFPQQGQDLGEKMHNAICHTLNAGYSRCVLIGSDLPLLRADAIDEALRLLQNHDMVLCPTEDGGYYLIGMNEPCEGVFRLKYSVSTVFEGTLSLAEQYGKTCAVGQTTMDIDEPSDLFRLIERLNQEDQDQCPATRALLESLEAINREYRPNADHKI